MNHLPENHSGATSDEQLMKLWLSGRPESSVTTYKPVAMAFLQELPDGLQGATVAQVMAWAESLNGKPATIARKISTVKSLLSFGHRTGYLVFNVGLILRSPKIPDTLNERIVEEDAIGDLIGTADYGRDKVLIRFLYASGARIAEAVGLRFKDINDFRVTLQGKGTRTRTLHLPSTIADELRSLRRNNEVDEAPVFKSYRGKQLTTRDARRIVTDTGKEAGLKMAPHFLRHAHASHALDAGAPITLVKHSLGHRNVATTSRYLHARPKTGASSFLRLVK